ncbi:MAG: hypothetical protein GXP37_04385 [Chloroflexi bacterium]|nr:hypothetical protein [Chloroflexota bacterium]
MDRETQVVEWWVQRSPPHQDIVFAWGICRRGQETGVGLRVKVEAETAFTLIMHTSNMTFVEPIHPGTHRFVLTHLDRSDVDRGAEAWE